MALHPLNKALPPIINRYRGEGRALGRAVCAASSESPGWHAEKSKGVLNGYADFRAATTQGLPPALQTTSSMVAPPNRSSYDTVV
jgi:hypothetical protein